MKYENGNTDQSDITGCKSFKCNQKKFILLLQFTIFINCVRRTYLPSIMALVCSRAEFVLENKNFVAKSLKQDNTDMINR